MRSSEEAIKRTNERQKEFYESKKKNVASRVWSYFRNGILNRVRKDVGIQEDLYNQHILWFGDLSNKKVLDLGCFSGNYLSVHLAKRAKEYVGIDLSETAIAVLDKRLQEFPRAKAIAVDFLSTEFEECNFDLIYAYGVLHHFRDTDLVISRLKEKLAPNGRIISTDPLKTSLPIRTLRAIYRPFQTDKEWEWPFSKKTYRKYKKAFIIKDRRSLLAKSKWAIVLNFMPLSKEKRAEIAHRWHKEDWEKSKISESHMFRGMHLTLWMQKKD